MTRFDRYMLSQFVVLFGFFALVLVSIFWINKAVRMFDRLIGDGQPAWVFLEFTALTLPGVIGVVLPIAAFAAAVFVVNRLSCESELTVMQATGYSPLRLTRSALVFGVLVAVMMSVLTHYLIPTSLGQLRLRLDEVSQNISAKLLSEGEFLHPAPGITVYIRDISDAGELRDVFLSDRRDPAAPVTYTSSRAYLVQDVQGTRLVMVAGLAQNIRAGENRLFTTRFDDFSYDISQLMDRDAIGLEDVSVAGTREMLRDPEAVAQRSGASLGEVVAQLHGRVTGALFCVVAVLVGFCALLVGSYSRFGVWRQILLAFGLLVVLRVIDSAATAAVLGHAALWPVLYLPVVLGGLAVAALLARATYPGGLGRLLKGRPRRDAGAPA